MTNTKFTTLLSIASKSDDEDAYENPFVAYELAQKVVYGNVGPTTSRVAPYIDDDEETEEDDFGGAEDDDEEEDEEDNSDDEDEDDDE